MERVLDEQCEVVQSDEDSEKKIEVKASKYISSDSLQNLSDPDASYDGHKAQGYQVQVQETYTTNKKEAEGEGQKGQINVITHVALEPSHKSDAKALIPAIEKTEEQNVKPEELLADSLYGSKSNSDQAANHGVKIISPMLGPKSKDSRLMLSDFKLTNRGYVDKCPNNVSPVEQRKKARYSISFALESCNACPLKDKCPVKRGSKYYYLRYTQEDLENAKRRAYEESEEFRGKYRWRAGVEATMSEIDRKTGIKQLRVRGLKRVRFAAIMKVTGINLFRAVRHLAAIKRQNIGIFVNNYVLKLLKSHIEIFLIEFRLSGENFMKNPNFKLFLSF